MYIKFKLLLMVKLLERTGRFPVVAIVTRQLMESQPPPLMQGLLLTYTLVLLLPLSLHPWKQGSRVEWSQPPVG